MPRKRDPLNVRAQLEHVVSTCEDMLGRDGKYEGGLVLAPIDVHNLREMKLIAQATLKRHAAKRTRKDLYVEAEA